MKITPLLIGSLLILALISCKKQQGKMLIIRDCTGTYLRFQDKDYHVCNTEKTDFYADNVEVNITFKSIKKCNGPGAEGIYCELYHKNEGWIEVEEIK